MRRRLVLLSVILLALVVGLAAAAMVFRVPLAEAVIENRLAALGIPAARLELTALGRDSARFAALHAGDNGELRADALEVRYDLTRLDLSAPQDAVESVVLEGLLLRLDLTRQGPPLGSLQHLMEGGDETAGGLPYLPPIALRNARIEAHTPLGHVSLTLDGTLGPADNGGLSGKLAFNAEGGPGRMDGTVFAEASADGAASGSLTIDDGHLQMSTTETEMPLAVEGLSGAVAFTLEDWQPVSVTGELSTDGLQHPGGAADKARLSFDVTPERAVAEARFDAADGQASGTLDLTLQDYAAAPVIDAQLTASASAGARLLELLPTPRPTAGDATFDLHVSGTLAPFNSFGEMGPEILVAPVGLEVPTAWLGLGDITLESRLSLSEVDIPERVQRLGASLIATSHMVNNGLTVTLREAAKLSADAVAADWLAMLGLTPELADGLRGGGDLSLRVPEDSTALFHLDSSEDNISVQVSAAVDATLKEKGASSLTINASLSGLPESFDGLLDVAASSERFAMAGATITNAEVKLPLAVTQRADELRLSLTAPGRLAAARVQREGIEIAKPAVRLDTGRITVGPGAGAFDYECEAKPEPFALTVPGAQGPIALALGPVTLSGKAEAGTPYEGKARLSGGSVRLENPAVTLEGLRGEAVHDASFTQIKADLAAAVTSRDEPALLVPLALSGRLLREGPALRLDATVSPKDAAPEAAGLRLPITARYDLDKGRGQVSLSETAISFTPGGLQPNHLVPSLSALTNVAGKASVTATLGLGGAEAASSAKLDLQGLSFRSGSNQVNGLDLALTLDSLQPPASPPGQRLTIAGVQSLLPIEDIGVSFQIPAAEEPQVRLERLGFRLAGGDFEARDSLLVLGAPRQALAFEVTGLELAPLFAALSVGGLTGSGTLDGRLPVALEGDEFVVEGGHLESRAPGSLAYRSPSLQSSLPPDADDLTLLQSPVDLAILAMGNFQYDKLSLDLDKAAAGETDIKLHVEGKNPDLLDGYPFVFNINLKGNLNPLIAALRQGATLSDDMIRRTWRMAP